MYTEDNLESIKEQLKKSILTWLVPEVLLLGGVIYSLVVRKEWLTNVFFIALGVLLIFSWGLFISPVDAYRKHVNSMLHGRTKETTGFFKQFGGEIVDRDKVRYYPLLISVGNLSDEKDDRLFYYDANLDLPDWQVGEALVITSHDNAIARWERVQEQPVTTA